MAASTGSNAGKELILSVPQGGQVIRTFNVTPGLPSDGKAGDWLWVDTSDPTVHLSTVRVKFSIGSSAVEQDYERAILVINLQQNTKESGYWRFSSSGVAVDPKYKDLYGGIECDVTDDGEVLVVHIQAIGDIQGGIHFGFVASYTDDVSGAAATYQSQDPEIYYGRP